MSTRSLNKVTLIGNLTRDPELRYTPAGTAVCTFGLATNRSWTTQTGETKEETEFHRIVAWNKLGELCSQLLAKGRKVYVEGRLATHSWTGQDGTTRTTTEIVIEDMIILDSKKPLREGSAEEIIRQEEKPVATAEVSAKPPEPSSLTGTKTEFDEPSEDKKTKKAEPTNVTETKAGLGESSEETKPKKGRPTQKDEDVSKRKETQEVSEDITPDDIPF